MHAKGGDGDGFPFLISKQIIIFKKNLITLKGGQYLFCGVILLAEMDIATFDLFAKERKRTECRFDGRWGRLYCRVYFFFGGVGCKLRLLSENRAPPEVRSVAYSVVPQCHLTHSPTKRGE